MIHGIINVYKEQDFTSHDVVAKLRGILHQKKIGHTGTLDPNAVGVLPVCLGCGTKLCDMLTDKDKVYRAQMILGAVTDTQDVSGQILHEASAGQIKALTAEQIGTAVMSFMGDYAQVPPMYSAIKVGGQKLYDLARQGREVERQPRQVHIHDIKIEEMHLTEEEPVDHCAPSGMMPIARPKFSVPQKYIVTMSVTCSKGTYIRTLIHDIGEKLQVGGCMGALTRIGVGPFTLTDALTLSDIEQLVAEGTFDSVVTQVEDMFPEMPKVRIKTEFAQKLYNGNALGADEIEPLTLKLSDSAQVRVYDPDGIFIAVYAYNKKYREFKVKKMFGI